MNINELALYVQGDNPDEHAREVLFAHTLLLCKQLALRHTVARYADDLSMDMIEDVLTHVDEYDPAKAGWMRWVYLRSRSVAQKFSAAEFTNFERTNGQEAETIQHHYDQLQSPDPYDKVAAGEDLSYVYSLVYKLSARQRQAFVWYHIDEHPTTYIAARLRMQENAARQLIHRARDTFLRLWEEEVVC